MNFSHQTIKLLLRLKIIMPIIKLMNSISAKYLSEFYFVVPQFF